MIKTTKTTLTTLSALVMIGTASASTSTDTRPQTIQAPAATITGLKWPSSQSFSIIAASTAKTESLSEFLTKDKTIYYGMKTLAVLALGFAIKSVNDLRNAGKGKGRKIKAILTSVMLGLSWSAHKFSAPDTKALRQELRANVGKSAESFWKIVKFSK